MTPCVTGDTTSLTSETHGVRFEMSRKLNEPVESQDLIEPVDNVNFVQVSRLYLKEWRLLTKKNALACEILMYLIEHMGRTTNAIVCSYTTLMEITGVSRASVARAVKVLKDDRWVEAVKVGNATAYCINANAFWQASRNQKKYAIFQATVIASSSEQESGFHEKAKHKLRYIPFVDETNDRVLVGDELLPPPDQTDLDLD